MSSTISALSSIARLSIGMTMSIPSQISVDTDAASATLTPSAVSFPYPPSKFQSANSTVKCSAVSTDQLQYHDPHHRYSCPSAPFLFHPHSASRSTESMQSWPLNREGVTEIFLPVKNSPQRDGGVTGRRRKSVQLPKLTVSSASTHSGDDIISDMTSLDTQEHASDVGDYVVERPSMASVMCRKLNSADVYASSPVNSTGVAIVIDAANDNDDVIVVFGDDESISGRDTDAPSGERN